MCAGPATKVESIKLIRPLKRVLFVELLVIEVEIKRIFSPNIPPMLRVYPPLIVTFISFALLIETETFSIVPLFLPASAPRNPLYEGARLRSSSLSIWNKTFENSKEMSRINASEPISVNNPPKYVFSLSFQFNPATLMFLNFALFLPVIPPERTNFEGSH